VAYVVLPAIHVFIHKWARVYFIYLINQTKNQQASNMSQCILTLSDKNIYQYTKIHTQDAKKTSSVYENNEYKNKHKSIGLTLLLPCTPDISGGGNK